MQRLLLRRTLRDLRSNIIRYLALLAVVAACMVIVTSIGVSAQSVIRGVSQTALATNVEDGEFSTLVPLTDAQLAKIRDRGVSLEAEPYLDFMRTDGSTLRVMATRDSINRVTPNSGRLPQADDEVLLEQHYARAHGLSLGDTLDVGERRLAIVGIGSSSDYDMCVANMSDASIDHDAFGTAFVTSPTYARLLEEGGAAKAETCLYAYTLPAGHSSQELRELLKNEDFDVAIDQVSDPYFQEYVGRKLADRRNVEDALGRLTDGARSLQDALGASGLATRAQTRPLAQAAQGLANGVDAFHDKVEGVLDEHLSLKIDNLTSFVEQADNPRIKASASDVQINIAVSQLAGVIVVALIAYVVSVFVVHSIERESTIIGTLYALGVSRRQLMLSYAMLPVLVCLAGGVMGTVWGSSPWMVHALATNTLTYYSLPPISFEVGPRDVAFGVVMPAVMALVVNGVLIRQKLSRPVLLLLRNELDAGRVSTARIRDRGSRGFVRTFSLRQLLRERRSVSAVLAGMFVCLLILFLALDAYAFCENSAQAAERDTSFGYLYTVRYPPATVPEGAYEAYLRSLSVSKLGYTLDVSLLGLRDDNPFFPRIAASGEGELSISSAMASKLNLSVGDSVVLTDQTQDRPYAFTVREVVRDDASLRCFMRIEDMRALFGEDGDCYNALLSDHALNIEAGRLDGTLTRERVIESTVVWLEMMWPMVILLVTLSSVIFIVVTYLMVKVTIDRAARPIALMKVFGYRRGELRRLYLDGNLVVVAAGLLVLVPLCKLLIDLAYPYLVANVGGGLDVTWPPSWYAVAYVGALVCYLVVEVLLMRRVNRIAPTEALQTRE